MNGAYFSRLFKRVRESEVDLSKHQSTSSTNMVELVLEDSEAWSSLLKNVKPQPNPENLETENRYSLKVNDAQGGYLTTDDQGVILEADHNLALLLHTSWNRLPGKLLSAFISKEFATAFGELLESVNRTDRILEWKAALHLKNAKNIPVTIIASSSCNKKDSPNLIRWFIRDDFTYQDADANQIRQLDKQVDQVKEQLEKEIDRREAAEKSLEKARASLSNKVEVRNGELANANQRLQAELAERRRAEKEAARKAQQISALQRATAALLNTLDLEPLLGQILDAVTSAIPPAEKGMLHMIARDTGQLEMRAVIGYTDPRIQKFKFPGNRGYVAKAVRERSPLLIPDIYTDPSIRYDGTIPEVRAIQSAIVAPLILSDTVLGALSLDASIKNAFTPDDLELLVSFAATATAAIHNALLHAEVQKLALTDTLTNLYNRRGFFELGRREVERTRRFNRPLSAIMIDMDHFKGVNDNYGHANGDQVLRLVAARLKNNIREIDIIGRYGGDEFTILLPETDLFVASNVAERLRQCISDTPMMIGEDSIHITISLGAARLTPDAQELSDLLDRADAAMYTAKQAGRNRVEVG